MRDRVGVKECDQLVLRLKVLQGLKLAAALEAAVRTPVGEGPDGDVIHPHPADQLVDHAPSGIVRRIDDDPDFVAGVVLPEQRLEAALEERVGAADTEDHERRWAFVIGQASAAVIRDTLDEPDSEEQMNQGKHGRNRQQQSRDHVENNGHLEFAGPASRASLGRTCKSGA